MPGEESPQAGRRRRVLVVDDEPVIRTLVPSFLVGHGYLVRAAGSVADARAALELEPFDVVLTDKNLPDGTGLDLALAAARCDAALVVMTAYANVRSAVDSLRLGIADYLEKPFEMDQLVECLRRAAARQELARSQRLRVEDLTRENEALTALAVRDPLTRLFNHAHLQATIDREMGRCSRAGSELGLVLLDVDGFKALNEQQGHLAGDRVLERLAALLDGRAFGTGASPFRARGHDVVARTGADEFALLLPDAQPSGLLARAEELRDAVEEFDFGVGQRVTVSVGAACWPFDGRERDAFVAAAGRALDAARRVGGNRVVSVAEAQSGAGRLAGDAVGGELRRARAVGATLHGRLVDYVYQPIVRADGAAFAWEGLCRPRHPEFSGPLGLIEAAERSGQLAALSRLMRQRCAEGLARLPPGAVLFLNLHPQDLNDPDLLELGVPLERLAGRVVFEITEVTRIHEWGKVKDVMQRLRALGFRFALDDLGSGYSGLNSLAMLTPEFVKLDMSLVRAMDGDQRARRLVRHLVEFARDEQMQVVAEGIETEEQREAVVELGCELLQGFLIGRPARLGEDVAASA